MATDSTVFRQKLAEALSRGGLSDQAVAAEVLLLLPSDFVDAYEVLFLESWGNGPGHGSVRIGDVDGESPVATKWRTSTNQVETRGTASTKGRGSTSKGLGPKNSRAAATKQWADRRLRKLAREIQMRLSDEDAPQRRCAGKCRRMAEDTWNYCPNCGAPTEEME